MLAAYKVIELFCRPMPLGITDNHILRKLKRNPLKLGYNTTVWTVETLVRHLSRRYYCAKGAFTLYRRMKATGFVCWQNFFGKRAAN
jgi:hypothetical protein